MQKKGIMTIIIVSVTLIVIALCLWLGKILNQNNEQYKEFSTKNIVIKVGTTLSNDVKDYINESIENTKQLTLDISNVDAMKEGTYTYSVSNKEITKTGTIDVVSARYMEAKDVYLKVGETLDKADLIAYSDLDTFTIRILSEETTFNKPGKYPISFLIIEDDEKAREFNVTVHVYEKETLEQLRTNDLEYAYNNYSHNIEITEHDYYIKFEKAVESAKSEKEEIYKDVIKDINDYKENNIKIINLYNKYGYIIGFAVYKKIETNSIYDNQYMFLQKE